MSVSLLFHNFCCYSAPDKCSDGVCPDEHSICVETSQGAVCVCGPGYQINGAEVCEDVNECDTYPCGDNAQCQNEEGFFQCTCNEGYVRVNSVCVGMLNNAWS